MAVYTHVTDAELKAFLEGYAVGDLVSVEGIAEGVENTNYRLETTAGQFILTLFERRVNEADVPFFLSLMNHLAEKKLPAPRAVADVTGAVLRQLAGRPAVIITFMPGAPEMTPGPRHCSEFGRQLAHLHNAVADFHLTRENDLGLDGWKRLEAACMPRANECTPGLSELIVDEVAFQSTNKRAAMPRGVVHADLFPDNVFFENGRVSGVIDFYFACEEDFAYDLAIGVNAWAFLDGAWLPENAKALVSGYQSVRRLLQSEKAAFPVLLRGAALRFLLTRLYDWLNQVEGAVVNVKDPIEYQRLLEAHRNSATFLEF